MTDLNHLFQPENKFVVPVTIRLSAQDQVKLLKYINFHYLGDVDANEFVDGYFKPKYPDKETKEFKNAVWNINAGYTINLSVEFDEKGVPTFEVLK